MYSAMIKQIESSPLDKKRTAADIKTLSERELLDIDTDTENEEKMASIESTESIESADNAEIVEHVEHVEHVDSAEKAEVAIIELKVEDDYSNKKAAADRYMAHCLSLPTKFQLSTKAIEDTDCSLEDSEFCGYSVQ